jgi:hemolysin III
MDFHEPFSSLSHLAFAAFMLFAGGILLRLAPGHSAFRRWAIGLYALSAVLLYTASGLFHGVRYSSEAARELFRRFDLTGIFLLVAGSYLPVFAYLLNGRWRVGMTAAVGSIAAVGIAAVWLLDAPKSGTMVPIYATMAAVGLIPLPKYLGAVGGRGVFWMFAAAGVYAAGGVCEVLKWPVLWDGVIGPHEVLHVTDILGTLVHLLLVVWLVRRTFPPPTRSSE